MPHNSLQLEISITEPISHCITCVSNKDGTNSKNIMATILTIYSRYESPFSYFMLEF